MYAVLIKFIDKIGVKTLTKNWQGILILLLILGIPTSSTVKTMADQYIDYRINSYIIPLAKTQDSLLITFKENQQSNKELKESVEHMSETLNDLQKWLITNNRSNRRISEDN